ncbi:MAG: AAA family ATPase, partial [Demequinaceae bacterium]|nr:AAA family ATPase [Demequinaceae bacterium]
CAETDGTSSSIGAVTRRGPVVRVHADTAEALARSRAGALPDPTLGTLHWADAAALAPRHSGPPTTVEVVAGVRSDDPTLPWTISIGGSRLTLIAGAPGSGKTTLLATIAGALAIDMPPEDLALVILCGRTAGVLGPYMGLPHVRASKSRVRPGAALRVVNSLDHDAALTVIVADDIDALGRDGRTVAARLEEIAAQEDPWRVHVVMATRRPAAVLTPSLRASGGTTIALRTENDADALEMIGIGTAAGIPIGSPGRAFVRASGQVYGVQAALPLANRSPRVRRCDAPTREATSLAAAARVAAGPTRRIRPDRLGQTRPAS